MELSQGERWSGKEVIRDICIVTLDMGTMWG